MTAGFHKAPLTWLAEGFDWSGRSSRAPFVICQVALIAVLIVMQQSTQSLSVPRAILVLLAAGLLVPAFGQARRRLRDLGWSGWWMWGLLIPLLSLVLWLFLALKKGKPDAVAPGGYSRLAFGFISVLAVLLGLRAVAEPFWIPAGSMKPTLLVGDYLIVSRQFGAPERGDVVVFRHPATGADFIKRVIGLPGETVEMRDGQVILNGVTVPQEGQGDWTEIFGHQGALNLLPRCRNFPVRIGEACLKSLRRETLPGGRQHHMLDIGPQKTDDTGVFEIPEGHYFMLGDNRDNSSDSRIPVDIGGVGFVPEENIKGTAMFVVLSLTGMSGRFLKGIE